MDTQTVSMPITAEIFRDIFRLHPAGIGVITADAGDGPVGMTVTSIASVSAEPALIVFSASDLSSSTQTLLSAEHIVVHLIDAASKEVAQLCATSGVDRFADTSQWDRYPTGEPYFKAAPRAMRCRIVNKVSAGLSTVIIAQVIDATLDDESALNAPLVYRNRVWHELQNDG